MLSRFAGDFLIVWIPACAGMTQLYANGLFGFMTIPSDGRGQHHNVFILAKRSNADPMVYEKISALRHISVVQKEAIRHLHSSTSRQKGNSP